MHTFKKLDIRVFDALIQKFAEKYLEQRSYANFNYADLDGKLFSDVGFNTDELKKIITQNAVAIDLKRENGEQPQAVRDIFRSDLGELLMTYYFEEKLPDGERFVIPLKNISFRERSDMPGRGLDAIGYQLDDTSVKILLGEAKVSAAKENPPSVVDSNKDSLYATHKNYHENPPIVIQRLTEYCKRLNPKDASILGLAIILINNNESDRYSITYGCTLIRDYECVDEEKDFGKLKNNSVEFEPNSVHFSILSFSNKTIDETVDEFYHKVRELITPKDE
ncbi:MAG: hypothetical protein IKQ46_03660 [Bacteroidales bacterium]|nr:hypothetical protein [Bacteroidales bacterium]